MSDMYAIKGSTLTAMGDAIRSKNGIVGEEYYTLLADTTTVIMSKNSGATKYRFIINILNKEDISAFSRLDIYEGVSASGSLIFQKYGEDIPDTIEFLLNQPTINITLSWSGGVPLNLDIVIIPLDENGEEYKYTPLEMVDKINGLSVLPEEAFTITGDCSYRFQNNSWNWFVEDYGNKVITNNITNAFQMFYYSDELENILFEINVDNCNGENMFSGCGKLKKAPKINGSFSNISGMFSNCSALEEIPNNITFSNSSPINSSSIFYRCEKLKTVPYIYNLCLETFSNVFYYCYYLREIPEDWCDTWNWDEFHTDKYATGGSTFNNCRSLRKIPTTLLNNHWNMATSSYNCAYSGAVFYACHALDEVKGLGVTTATLTSSIMNLFGDNYRLKSFTFQTNEDGTPKTASWKKQTLDLSSLIGYGKANTFSPNATPSWLPYNSGIDVNKRVIDDATYQALKDDPDWYTTDVNYSRYNHDSAVETINSLPDCSAYLATTTGNNTIKFKGEAGALTDGGAINTLTEEEIAVAVAKGWTVTLV